jgi:hypothetical protein
MNWRVFMNIKESSLALWFAIERRTPNFYHQIEALVADKDAACKNTHY